jgi:WD40-like Beta Propeller Repeat
MVVVACLMALVLLAALVDASGVVAASSSPSELGYVCPTNAKGGVSGACVVGDDGSDPRLLFSVNNPSDGAVLSPDGRRAAFTSWSDVAGGNGGLYVTSVTGSGTRLIGGSDWCATCRGEPGVPEWNPAGTELALTEPTAVQVSKTETRKSCQVWVTGIGAKSKPRVLRDGSGSPIHCTSRPVAWSPNGKSVAVITAAGLLSVPATGGTPTVLYHWATAHGGSKATVPTSYNSLSWSPNGKTILAASTSAIELFPAAGGPPRRILPVGTLADGYRDALYSPDGTRVVLATTRCEIESATSAGAGLAPLPGIPAGCSVTTWSRQPPGQQAAAYAASPGVGIVYSNGQVAGYGSHGFQASPPLEGLAAPVSAAVVSTGPTPVADPNESTDCNGTHGVVCLWRVTSSGVLYGPSGAMSPTGWASPSAPIVALTVQSPSGDTSLVAFGSDGSDYPPQQNIPQAPTYIPADGPVTAALAIESGTYSLVTTTGKVVTGLQPTVTVTPTPAAPAVAAAFDPAISGAYWVVTADGQVYGEGAPVAGSLAGRTLPSPIVGIAADYLTGGYWLAAKDGTIYGFNAPPETTKSIGANAVAILARSAPTLGKNACPGLCLQH